MNTLKLTKTALSPGFWFSPKGLLKIEGRAVCESIEQTFAPAIEWCRDVTTDIISLSINLEYLSIASSRQLLYLFSALSTNPHVKSIIVSWYFYKEDRYMLEDAMAFKELFPELVFILKVK